jgi:hypothetical protein
MNRPSYEIAISNNRRRYEFVSIGPKGTIHKAVEYLYLDYLNVWNLGFGDLDLESGYIADDVVSDNGDGPKVLTTVALTLLEFLDEYPNEVVIFTGSDDRRTRIYYRIIKRFRFDFDGQLQITSLTLDGIEVDIETDMQHSAFIIRRTQNP